MQVVDRQSNVNDNISHAAEFLGKSVWRQRIFEEIYKGKPRPKSALELSEKLGCSAKQVLDTGNQLQKAGLVEQKKDAGRVAYQKEGFLDQYKRRILRYAKNPNALKALPTKVNPKRARSATVSLKVWGKPFDVRPLTVDDISSFTKVGRVKPPENRLALSEKAFKEGVKKVIGERGRFVDMPGERFDVFSTHVRIGNKRIATAFAFKGPGKRGILKPLDMGRNGDQIQRLFGSRADLFMVQYWGQVDESVYQLMETFAVARSVHTGKRVYYGVIDGADSDRLVLAYPKEFGQTG